jgi:hypothetical protein
MLMCLCNIALFVNYAYHPYKRAKAHLANITPLHILPFTICIFGNKTLFVKN